MDKIFKDYKKPNWFMRLWYKFKNTIENYYYGIKNGCPWLIRTRLPVNSWYDTDTRLLYGCMNLLVDFVEKEQPFEHTDYDHDNVSRQIKKDIEEIYSWWKNYENRLIEIDKNLTRYLLKEITLEEMGLLEDKLRQEEIEMLIKLVKIKSYLWT